MGYFMLKWCLWNQDATLDGCCWELPQALLLFFSFLGFFPPLFTFPVGVVKKQAVGGCCVWKVLAWEFPGMVFKLFMRSLEQFVENTKVSNVRVCWRYLFVFNHSSGQGLGCGEIPPVEWKTSPEIAHLCRALQLTYKYSARWTWP